VICVSIAKPEIPEVLDVLGEIRPWADLAEVRLDALNDPEGDLGDLRRKSPLPLVYTNRPLREGGAFTGTEEARVGILGKAVSAGVAYIDIELSTESVLREACMASAKAGGTRVIISFHDFSETPAMERLMMVLEDIQALHADAGKIVTMAHGPGDVARLFALYERSREPGLPLVAFCMGEAGRLSRLACLALGAPFTYASTGAGGETAPGQIPARDMRNFLDYFKISGKR